MRSESLVGWPLDLMFKLPNLSCGRTVFQVFRYSRTVLDLIKELGFVARSSNGAVERNGASFHCNCPSPTFHGKGDL